MTTYYTATEYADIVEAYTVLLAKGSADLDLTEVERDEVGALLVSVIRNIRKVESGTVSARRASMAHARVAGSGFSLSDRAIDRAVDILANL